MQTLTSNGVPVPFDGAHFAPLRDSSALLGDPEALRLRYHHDGYLYLREVIDPGRVRRLRGRYFSRFDPTYFAPGTAPEDGVYSGHRPAELPAHGVAGHPAHDFVRSPEFKAFAAADGLRRLAEDVLGGPCTQLPRLIARHFDRSRPVASRAHVDFSYLDGGSDRLVTMWIPLGDCSLATGGLVYLEGSQTLDGEDVARLHAVSDRPEDHRPISHDLAWVAESLERRWLWSDYRAGDVTIHSPYLVHASLDTATDTMRLSADVRFLRDDQPADPRWLQPWSGDDGN
jgi:ectoine hydroxylase-related dioxygenase (phytanoyl-CoA dioxygenase family)